MSILVNHDDCIGCGVCASICPEVFEMGDDGKAKAVSQKMSESVKNAKESCPVQAISL